MAMRRTPKHFIFPSYSGLLSRYYHGCAFQFLSSIADHVVGIYFRSIDTSSAPHISAILVVEADLSEAGTVVLTFESCNNTFG